MLARLARLARPSDMPSNDRQGEQQTDMYRAQGGGVQSDCDGCGFEVQRFEFSIRVHSCQKIQQFRCRPVKFAKHLLTESPKIVDTLL
jgi:hypothetical protein